MGRRPRSPVDPTDGAPAVTPAVASELVAACERAWSAIQRHHPDVPHPVIVLGSGVERGRLVKLGHWWAARWIADGEPRGEVLLAGEALHLPAPQVFEVLLHEAAHGLNAARGIRDTSRGGRYHNRLFKTTAEEVGLAVTSLPPYGWANTALGPGALQRYRTEIEEIATAARLARRLTGRTSTTTEGEAGRDQNTGTTEQRGRDPAGPAMCGCGRRMRMAPSVLAQGPVVCGLCGETFATRARTVEIDASHPAEVPSAATASAALRARGLDEITGLDLDAQTAQLLTSVATWYGQRQNGNDTPLCATRRGELDGLNRLARAMLVLDGTLHEPSITVDGRELAVGEYVVLAHSHGGHDLDGRATPPAGVFGTVQSIDPDRRELHIDFAIAGRHRIGADTTIGRSLTYGYAERAAEIIQLPLATPRAIVHGRSEPVREPEP
jgi:hypothetical protein